MEGQVADLREIRLESLKAELRGLLRLAGDLPVGTRERDVLADQVGEVVRRVVSLAEELED